MNAPILTLSLPRVALWASFASLFFCTTGILRAAPPRQAFVKVNQYYVLYTYPVVPYLNDKGVLMVGLEGFGRVIDHDATPHQEPVPGVERYGTVKVDVAARMETLTFDGYHLMFRAGSSILNADGRQNG
jgi:hypothetical protein